MLEEEELKGAVILIFANKQDLPGSLDDSAVTEALEMHKIKNRHWAIFKKCAVKGEGLFEGLDWYVPIKFAGRKGFHSNYCGIFQLITYDSHCRLKLFPQAPLLLKSHLQFPVHKQPAQSQSENQEA